MLVDVEALSTDSVPPWLYKGLLGSHRLVCHLPGGMEIDMKNC